MPSPFTSYHSESFPLPCDGTTITIRKLAPKHLQAAQHSQQLKSIDTLKDMGGPAFLKELSALGGDKAVAEARAANPLLAYDAITLLQHGITAWGYERPVDREALEDLDAEAQDYIAEKILRLARPAAFQSASEQEADRKNG